MYASNTRTYDAKLRTTALVREAGTVARIIRKSNGKYLVRWRKVGAKNETSKEFRDEAEAKAYKSRIENELLVDRAGKRLSPGGTISRFSPTALALLTGREGREKPARSGHPVEGYLRSIIESDKELRPSTRELYLTGLRVHIEGTRLGRADIRTVTGETVREYWSKLDIGIGARRNVYQLLAKTFNRAIREGLIDVSPLRRAGVRQPSKGRREEVIPLTFDKIEGLANGAPSTRGRLAILLMGFGALRAGEVGGLRLQDIDFERCELKLRQQVVRTRVEGKNLSPLKSRAARRTVSVPCSLTEELKAFTDSEPPADDGRVFHGPNGELWSHANINHMVKRAGKAAGLQGVFSHILRHSAVSIWIEDGHNAKAIQRMVGHSDSQTTLQIYGHLFDEGGAALADSMERRREVYRANGKNEPPDSE